MLVKQDNLEEQRELISIIIPVYNAEGVLHRSVESVLNQNYKNIEIIIIDDGSTDQTGSIIDEYAKKDSRIRVFHKINEGPPKARNLGVFNAKGSFVAFCDADDVMHPQMLLRMYNALKENDADMSICSWSYVDENGSKLNWRTTDLKNCCLDSIEAQKQFLTSVNFEGFCWNKLVKKEVYDQNNISYDETRASYCDMLAIFKLIQSSKRVSFIEDKLYDYYQMPNSCVHTPSIKKLRDYVEVVEQVKVAAEEVGLKKEGWQYQIYRLHKHLFSVYKACEDYEDDVMMFYAQTYKNYLDMPFCKKVQLAFEYPDENPYKFVVKMFIVKNFYNKITSK